MPKKLAIAPAPADPNAAPVMPPAQSATRKAMRAPIRQAPSDAVRNRKGIINQFELPDDVVAAFAAAGWSLEWKRHTVFNQPDPSNEVALAENAWESVTADEIPSIMPKSHAGAIIKDGLQLMKRPAYLTEQARREDAAAARDSVRLQEQKLGHTPAGQLTRDHQTARPKVGKSYEPMAVPQD